MGWIDSHCHLDFPQLAPAQTLLHELSEARCEGVLLPAVSLDSFPRVLQHVEISRHNLAMPKVYFALGLHPYFYEQHALSHVDELEKWIDREQPHAVGEIGIDYLLPEETWSAQWELLDAQLDVAQHYGLPVIIHCRRAHDLLSKRLKQKHFKQGGIIHAFSGSSVQAKRYLDLGFALGIGGAVTHSRAKAMQKMVAGLPDDAYVLETDSPDMAPAFAASKINTPLNLPKIAEFIASLRIQGLEEVYEDTNANFSRVILA